MQQKIYLERVPIPSKPEDEKISDLVKQNIAAYESLSTCASDKDDAIFKQKADLLDRQIDALVYELYGLNDEEIKIVEGLNYA